MREFYKNDKDKKIKGDEVMAELLETGTYKKLNISSNKIKEISVTPRSKDGKLLFDRENKNHRYIVDED